MVGENVRKQCDKTNLQLALQQVVVQIEWPPFIVQVRLMSIQPRAEESLQPTHRDLASELHSDGEQGGHGDDRVRREVAVEEIEVTFGCLFGAPTHRRNALTRPCGDE